jgi:hypothetical protein
MSASIALGDLSGRQREIAELIGISNYLSEICQALDGRVFRVADAAVGINYPPCHPHCRSTTIPYFPPDKLDGPSSRAARDADGKYYTVPAGMTYSQWREKYVDMPAEAVYNKFKEDVRSQIGSVYPTSLNVGQQNKHIAGAKNFDPQRGTLTANPEELIKLHAGKGDPIRTFAGNWNQRERFAHTDKIGIWRDTNTGEEAPTNVGIIHYTKTRGAHIVPANPKQRRRR